MKVLGLPKRILALIFDMDGTLYTHREYVQFQESSQVTRLAWHLNIGEAEAHAALNRAREARRVQGLPRTSMANLFLSFGIDMSTIVRWREEELHPDDWLQSDPMLDITLAALQKRFRLALLTNNPRKVGEESLEALGVRSRFEFVIGLDDSFASKPAREPFIMVCSRLGLEPTICVSIGDREDVDLATALDLGMGAILVDGVQDLHNLPEILPA